MVPFLVYLTVLFVEWSPSALEWLGIAKIRNIIVKLTLVLTIFGVPASHSQVPEACRLVDRSRGSNSGGSELY